MVDVSTNIEIRCPLDKVYEYASNPDNAPAWYINIKSAEWKTPKPPGVGSKIAFIAYFLGKKLKYTYEITEMSRYKFVMKTAEGPFPMETTYLFEPIDAVTTRITLRNRGNPTGFSKLLGPFMGIMMKKANKKDLLKLKSILEMTR